MTSSVQTTTLHELASKSFSRTPNGLIFTDDLKTVFSVFMICLDLQDDNKGSKKWFSPFEKTIFPFSFSMEEAVERMKNLELQVDMNSTYINISYNIQPELAYHLLEAFMAAKLLHTPADRTRNEPKENVLLQPTPKGVGILQKYVRDIGLKDLPKILLSDFNSMELFVFERSSMTNSIIHSNYLINILFVRIMGSHPNVWSPTNLNDKIPSLSKLLEYNNDTFSFEDIQFETFNGFDKRQMSHEKEMPWLYQVSDPQLQNDSRISPFAHKYFTNPDSDSHIQYYVSDSGLRLSKSKVFGQNKTVFDYCFTTKALWQWIMDCTDIMYPKEAVSVAALFLRAGLIVPIILPPSENTKRKFNISRLSYYTLTKRGLDITQWNTENGIKKATNTSTGSKLCTPTPSIKRKPSDVSEAVGAHERTFLNQSSGSESEEETIRPEHSFINIDDILQDPGMRYLFRRYLERYFCAENLDAFIEIKKFLKKMTLLKKLIDSKHINDLKKVRKGKTSDNNITATIDCALARQANECLEIGYHIYATYIMVKSPYQLNIDHNLRESISRVMLKPTSPVSDAFPVEHDFDHEMFKELVPECLTPLDSPLLSLTPAACHEPIVKLQHPRTVLRDATPVPLQFHATDSKTVGLTSLQANSYLKIRDNKLSTTFKVLKNLYPLFEKVNQNLHRLMKIDSLQKFMSSQIYQEAVTFMAVS